MATYLHDLENNTVSGTSLAVGAAKTTTTNGSVIDMLQADSLVNVQVVNGVITDGTHTITVEESTVTNTGFTAVTLNQDLDALTSSSTAGTVQFANFQRSKRYVRAVTTVQTATSGGYYSVFFLGQKKFVAPTSV